MNSIPAESKVYERMVKTWNLRMMRSASWGNEQRVSWVRFYKRYRQIVDAVFDADEPNIRLGYIFGLIEQINSKAVEPLLNMRPPCEPKPIKMGDMNSAENFKNIARSWYSQPNMQEPLSRSKKEMVICGPRWEVDEWVNIQRKGKMWGKVPKEIEIALKKPDGTPLMGKDGKPVTAKTVVQVDAEVDIQVPIHYGFHTRYPSVFNMYPEPDRKTIGTGLPTDASWVLEDMGELALEDMAREFYVDPYDGTSKPMFDFTALLHDAGRNAEERYKKIMAGSEGIEDSYGPLIVPIKAWSYLSDYGREDKDTVYPTESTTDRAASEDRDKIWVVRGYTPNEMITIANGKYIIQRIENPWHKPIMPIRIENLVNDPEFIYGYGAIKPIEDELDIMNDIANLSMSQFIRIVGKLMAVSEGRIVSMNDFKLGAGGKVRVTGDGPVRDAVAEIPQASATNEMLALESWVKGDIEFIDSSLDGSMGTSGTKQGHKTARGMEMVVANLSPRYATIHRQGLINEARRMQSMERFFSQYCWEKQPFNIVRDDGSTTFAEFNKDDIYTAGRGFVYSVEIDPSFGNTAIQRQDSLDAWAEAVKYEELRLKMGDPTMRKMDLPKLFERVLMNFGWKDTSEIFTLPGMEQSPENELQMLMQGSKNVACSGNLLHHIETHILQLNSPNLKSAMEANKADPDTMKNLQLLISQAMAKVNTFMKDPAAAAEAKKGEAMRTMPS